MKSITHPPDCTTSVPRRAAVRCFPPWRWPAGYTLAEVLIASCVLLVGITAAAMLANSVILQEEANRSVAIAINLQEQAARLYHMGLSGPTITNLLPENCVSTATPGADAYYMAFSADSLRDISVLTNSASGASSNSFQVNASTNQIIFASGKSTNGTMIYRTNTILLLRPTNL